MIDKRFNLVYTLYILSRRLRNMTVTIQKWGNSHGVRLPKDLLEKVIDVISAEIELL